MLVETKPWKKKYKNQETIFFIVNPFPPPERDGHPRDRRAWAENELSDWLSKFLEMESISCIKFPEWGPLDVILVYVLMDSQEDIEKYEGVHIWHNILARRDQSEELTQYARDCNKSRMYSLVYAHYDSKEFKKSINKIEHSVKWITVDAKNTSKRLRFQLKGGSNLRDPRRLNQNMQYPLPEIPSRIDSKMLMIGRNYHSLPWVENHIKMEELNNDNDETLNRNDEYALNPNKKRKAGQDGEEEEELDDEKAAIQEQLKKFKQAWGAASDS